MEVDAGAATRIDPQDGEAHAMLGESLYYQGRFAESIASYDRALELNPSSADVAAFGAGILCFLGQPERAAALADRACALNSAYSHWYGYYLGPAYYFADRLADAATALGRMPPEKRFKFGWVLLAGAQALQGHDADARSARDAAPAVSPGFTAETGSAAGLSPANRLPECEAERAAAAPVKS